MRKITKKKKIKPQYFGKWKKEVFWKISIVFVLLLVVSVYFLVMGKSGYLVRWKMKKQMVKLGEEIKILRKEIAELKNEAKRLEVDTSYIEEQARELGMVKEGEKIIEFVPSEK